ncbi:MAG: undecaprenyldiphospho-muramoylpentapeptide beta-N-acetylglucosaminyltransferase [Paludibacteraceae bacterium]|nr:undecaprenyldiphospho-muramoylpentapeptide beta-N-acetylglucosaminyltransferase [Paludibacteraceae bacterium]MBQ6984803.1 undecaprenyldiphospho-muramoylpentapeptide beta-N-acetylglucosaminyltransferase [Paludibacteraceae bacterium]
MDTTMRYLISGGGTGGHIFPAVSIANALKELDPEAEILFVGALGRMEMERVPQAGYKIVGLPVRGFNRAQPWKNVSVLVNLAKSIRQVKRIIRDFKPNVGVGVGGYASGAAMWAAAKMGIPILLQEQNGFAGVTNKILKDKAAKICVAYENMDRFFPADKIILTGNPVRQNLLQGQRTKDKGQKCLLILGGSLGARTINEAIKAALPELAKSDIQVVWQTGKGYIDMCRAAWEAAGKPANIEVHDFLSDMPDRYAQADLVISRAGASSISEICLLGKPSILVPSPNVAEDHQTHNAMALVNKEAAVLVRDADATQQLVPTALALIQDEKKLELLHTNVSKLAQADSAKRIAEEVIALACSSPSLR